MNIESIGSKIVKPTVSAQEQSTKRVSTGKHTDIVQSTQEHVGQRVVRGNRDAPSREGMAPTNGD